jgi:predicted Zn-dependent protease with MMP-like domain
MLWLTQKRFVGSYRRLTAVRRSSFAGRSGPGRARRGALDIVRPIAAKSAADRWTVYRLVMLPANLFDPTDDDIEAMVVDALDHLPSPFRDQLGSVAIVIEDQATPDQLALVGARGLYGLYQGVPRTRWSADGAPTPSKITIFRAPLIRANGTPERLAAAVADTVYHEIAHHFGISDERIHQLKRGDP